MKCSAIFRRQVTNSFPHFSFECSFLRTFFIFVLLVFFSFGSIKFSHGKHFLLGFFFQWSFCVYLREQRKKKVLLSVFFFSAFFFWLGYANLHCCLCLFLTMCVCVWLWFSSRFFLLLLFVCFWGQFVDVFKIRNATFRRNWTFAAVAFSSRYFLVFLFLHFQFPFEFRSGLIKTNNDKNLIFTFGFSFIFFTVVVVAVAGSVSVLVSGPTPAAFA